MSGNESDGGDPHENGESVNGDHVEESPARSRKSSRSRSRSVSASPKRSHSRDRSAHHRSRRHRHRSYSRSRSRSARRSSRRHYSRSRSRSRSDSYEKHRSSRRRKSRDSRSPMSSRKRHVADRDAPPPSRCLGVFGMSLYTDEKALDHYFSQFGKIEQIQLVYDKKTGRSRGFGFIYFESERDAMLAKERATGIEIDGHRIRVDFSITRRPHTPTPGIYMGKPRRHDEYFGGRGRSPSPYGGGGRRRSRSYSYSPRRE